MARSRFADHFPFGIGLQLELEFVGSKSLDLFPE